MKYRTRAVGESGVGEFPGEQEQLFCTADLQAGSPHHDVCRPKFAHSHIKRANGKSEH